MMRHVNADLDASLRTATILPPPYYHTLYLMGTSISSDAYHILPLSHSQGFFSAAPQRALFRII